MVTVRETIKIKNDVKRFIAGRSPYDNPNVQWLVTTSANITPGMGVIRDAGVGGEAKCTEHGNDSAMVYAIAEFDPKQIANNGVAYGSGDLIPVLPLHRNIGLEMRNIVFTDPTGVVPADTPLCPEASGSWGKAIEATLTATTPEGFNTATNHVAGVNGADGSTIHNRVYLRTLYYYADADVEATIEARVVAC